MQPVLPSARGLVVAFLTDHPALSPLHSGRVGIDLTSLPGVRVSRVGGPAGWYEDRARISAECWADDAEVADLMARTLMACLPDIVTADGQVRGFGEVSGPLSRYDRESQAYQEVVDFSIYTYA